MAINPHEQGILLRPPEGSLTPVATAKGTANHLRAFFQDLPGASHARGFLKDYSIAWVNRAEKGLAARISYWNRNGNVTWEDMDRLFDIARTDTNKDPFNREAFDFSLVTFAFMPEQAKHPLLPKGFSRRGIFAPPVTSMEFLGRIREMRNVLAGIVVGETTPRTQGIMNQPLLRTQVFFETAAKLPDMYKEKPKLIVERAKEARASFENLLKDVKVDLPPSGTVFEDPPGT